MSVLVFYIVSSIAFLCAIVIHEVAHAWTADRLGDPTARLKGRITLNPLAHMDLYGTVLVPFFLILVRSPLIFGWAKPVIYDSYNLQNPKRDSAIIAFSGAAANFILSVILAIIFRVVILFPLLSQTILVSFLFETIRINLILGLFNLIPIHPLDGGKVFIGFLPKDQAQEADIFLRRYGMLILFLLIFPIWSGVSPVSVILWPVIKFILNILIPANLPV